MKRDWAYVNNLISNIALVVAVLFTSTQISNYFDEQSNRSVPKSLLSTTPIIKLNTATENGTVKVIDTAAASETELTNTLPTRCPQNINELSATISKAQYKELTFTTWYIEMNDKIRADEYGQYFCVYRGEKIFHTERQHRIVQFSKSDLNVNGYFPLSVLNTEGTDSKLSENERGNIFLDTAQDFVDKTITDVNKNGIPEIAYVTFSGGAHCCYNGKIVELNKSARFLYDLDTQDSTPKLIDVNNNSWQEIVAEDMTYKYWNTGFGGSAMPTVVYSYNKQLGHYKLDLKVMRHPAPSYNEMKSQAMGWYWHIADSDDPIGTAQKAEFSDKAKYYYGVPWGYALDLIYSGNANYAKQYIKLAWQNGEHFHTQTLEEFWIELIGMLEKSPNYHELIPIIPANFWRL